MKLSLIALAVCCTVASSAFAVQDDPGVHPPHVLLSDDPGVHPPHVLLSDDPGVHPPHTAFRAR